MLIIFEKYLFVFLSGICWIEVYNLRREKCPFLSFFVLGSPKTKFIISGGGNSAPSLPSRQTGGSSGGGYRSAGTKSHQKSLRVIQSHLLKSLRSFLFQLAWSLSFVTLSLIDDSRSGSTSNELVFTGALGNSNPNVKTAPQTKAGGDAINFGWDCFRSPLFYGNIIYCLYRFCL